MYHSVKILIIILFKLNTNNTEYILFGFSNEYFKFNDFLSGYVFHYDL